MILSTVTSKGQITIPKKIRDALNLKTGDRLSFTVSGGDEVVVRPVHKRVDDLFGRLWIPGRSPLSLEEMDAAIRRRAKESLR